MKRAAVQAGPFTGPRDDEQMARFRVQVVERRRLKGAAWPVKRETPRACHCAEAVIRMPSDLPEWQALLEDGLHDAELAAGGLHLELGGELWALVARVLYEVAAAVEAPARRQHLVDVLTKMVPALEAPGRANFAANELDAAGYGWSVVQAPPPIAE